MSTSPAASGAAGVASAVIVPGSLPTGAAATTFEFPWAGAALLIVLVAAAFAAKLYGRRAGARPIAFGRWLAARRGEAAPVRDAVELEVESSARLDAQTQLHVVRWGQRRVLLASRIGLSPVVLDHAGGDEAQAPAEVQP